MKAGTTIVTESGSRSYISFRHVEQVIVGRDSEGVIQLKIRFQSGTNVFIKDSAAVVAIMKEFQL